MIPPSPPISFKPLSQRPNQHSTNQHIPLIHPHDQHEFSKPSGKYPEILTGQGHVHTEILVHHRTDNIRPPTPPRGSPPRREYVKPQMPGDLIPPRRTEISVPNDVSHQYIFLGKPASNANDLASSPNRNIEKKPPKILFSNRPRPSVRPRPPLRITTKRPHERPMYIERPINHGVRKPVHNNGPQRPSHLLDAPIVSPTYFPPHREFNDNIPKNYSQFNTEASSINTAFNHNAQVILHCIHQYSHSSVRDFY